MSFSVPGWRFTVVGNPPSRGILENLSALQLAGFMLETASNGVPLAPVNTTGIYSCHLMLNCVLWLCQLFPDLEKVVFLDDDVVVQKDLGPLWDMDLHGKVNGAVETCHGGDASVMSKTFKNYFNFSHPIISSTFDPDKCAWAYGMNVFDLQAWRKADITRVYHYWQKQV